MNQNMNLLQPYPFQRLNTLFADITPNSKYTPVNLSIGEPKHKTPEIIQASFIKHINGLAHYPTTKGSLGLRQAIADWATSRYSIPMLDVEKQVIPVNGSREALFAIAQAVIDSTKPNPVVISPNPFYQIYEGAALLAGAEPYFINTLPDNDYKMDFSEVPTSVLNRTQLVYVCSPGNPSGKVMSLDEWKTLFDLSDQYGFMIAADECYSEIYFDEQNPPIGALQAAHLLGRDYSRLMVFGSLSKRSNVPGMRSGFVAGDAGIIEKFLLYRTYHGCAMNPAAQEASIAAWADETHVIENRRLYTEKFKTVAPMLKKVWPKVQMPEAAFYLWVQTDEPDTEVARRLYADLNITVLPGSYLAREAHGMNPGEGFIRMALVATLDECVSAAERIQQQ
jgi:N-succinyldiaminopimelate aminotransferase